MPEQSTKTLGETQRLKKEFRLNWAKDNLKANTEVRHRQEESWSRVQSEHGVYMPFEKIVWEEGGETSPAAVKAATFIRHERARDGWRVDQVQRHIKTHRHLVTRNWSPLSGSQG